MPKKNDRKGAKGSSHIKLVLRRVRKATKNNVEWWKVVPSKNMKKTVKKCVNKNVNKNVMKNVRKNQMPSSSRPRGGGSGGHGSQRTPIAPTPMSERQQMALVMQLTSQSHQTNVTAPSNVPQGRTRSRERNERGETALHVAAIKGDQEQVKKLVDQGVDPNVADFAGWTPLHEACSHGWNNIAVILVRAGANVNARGLDDDTPLHDAAHNGQLKLVKFLLESGADPFFKNKKGKMPFDVANPPAYGYLASLKESATSQRAQHTGRSRDDKKNTGSEENSTPIGSSAVMMDNAIKTEEKNETTKESGIASSTEKITASVTAIKVEGETNAVGSNLVSSTQEESSAVVSSSANKRSIEASDSAEGDGVDDEAVKRKKRKEPEPVKETAKPQQARINVGRGTLIAGSKPPGPASKTGVAPLSKGGGLVQSSTKTSVSSSQKSTVGLHPPNNQTKNVTSSSGNQGKSSIQSGSQVGKGGAGGQSKSQNSSLSVTQSSAKGGPDKKSPCPSPKPSAFVQAKDVDADNEESKSVDSGSLKVPPLKIVIPGGAGSASGQQEGDGSSTQRGSAKNRGGPATLPYIIHFSMNSAGEAVPTEMGDVTAADLEKRQSSSNTEDKTGGTGQRVLRSHRNADGVEKDKERGRSSPHTSAPPCSPSGTPLPTKTPPPSTSYHQPENEREGSSHSHASTSASGSGSGTSSHASTSSAAPASVELHPRKRKLKASKESHAHASTSQEPGASGTGDTHAHSSHPNPYQMFLNIRNQIDRKQKSLFPVQPKPPQGFKDYLLNRCTYVLGDSKPLPNMNPPPTIPQQMRDLFISQEEERHYLRVQHLVEKEKLVLCVEQEILRVHGRAARALANQSLPFSVCTLLMDREVYNMSTPEQEEKERNAQRSRYNGRLFLSWLQDVDDKWEKIKVTSFSVDKWNDIKEGMVRRHHCEAEALHGTQKMFWAWSLKDLTLCDQKNIPFIDPVHVPMVNVSDDFDLLQP